MAGIDELGWMELLGLLICGSHSHRRIVMLKYVEPLDWLPTAEELPDSDDRPVDNELQELALTLLKMVLAQIWAGRSDWFFGIDMGVYFNPDEPPIVPDAFLSVGVERVKSEDLRLNYVLWEEQGILPQLALEVVSKKYRGEYSTKKDFYERLGVLYYVIYHPRRRRKPTLEVYKLIQGQYLPVVGNPIWLPELGLGKERQVYQGIDREWLFWYDEQGNRYPTPQEEALQQRQRADDAEAALRELQARLRDRGIDPDRL
jgi:Uma2 family endonuclease